MVDSAIKHHVSLVRHFAFAVIHSSVLNLRLWRDATGPGKLFVGAAWLGFCESFQETQRQPAPREAAKGQWTMEQGCHMTVHLFILSKSISLSLLTKAMKVIFIKNMLSAGNPCVC